MSGSTTKITVHTDAFPGANARGTCQIVVVEGDDEGRAATVCDEPVIVGTDPSCDLVLADERVSRKHLEVRLAGGGLVVRDLDSRNGTFFEGSKLSEATLKPGATLKLGRTFLRLQPQVEAVEIAPSQSRRFGDLIAESLAMREVFAVLERAAQSDVTVLIEGETGTGKELAARAVHAASARRSEPFVVVDCGALPDNLLESELFGHVQGAFTGATGDRQGAFVRADGGTIFLDEIGHMSAKAQARLLRVCEQKTVRPVGADTQRSVDVRILAAGSGLERRVAEGSFRADLFYRLSVVHILLPPLRHRREDIAPIVEELMRRRGIEAGPIEGPNLDRLMAHSWPGNVRELRNVLERALALSGRVDSFGELRLAVDPHGSDAPLVVRTDMGFTEAKQRVIDAFEKRYLADVFARCDGNISASARAADMDRKYLRKLLERHNLL
jgi:DNA-binding NtrC family response regulator